MARPTPSPVQSRPSFIVYAVLLVVACSLPAMLLAGI